VLPAALLASSESGATFVAISIAASAPPKASVHVKEAEVRAQRRLQGSKR
jgi:hypothetical protein